MSNSTPTTFQQIPHTARGHFLLHLYAAIYHLINYIRRLSQLGGEGLDPFFERYPFLAGYFAEMQDYMPDELTWEGATLWWENEIGSWEQTGQGHLPLQSLRQQGQISFRSCLALMLIGLVEEDSRFGTIFTELHEPLTFRRPSLELVGQIMLSPTPDAHLDPWDICRPLLTSGLITVTNRDTPRSEWLLRIPTVLWNVLRDDGKPQPELWYDYQAVETLPLLETLTFPKTFVRQLSQIPTLIQSGKAEAVILRGVPGSARLPVMGAIARALGRGVINLKGGELNSLPGTARDQVALVGPLCMMTGALPVITYELGPGETAEAPRLAGYRGPRGYIMGTEGGLPEQAIEKAVTLTLPIPTQPQRLQIWQAVLAGYPVQNLNEISQRFHLPGEHIRQVASLAIAHAALEQRECIQMTDVQAASRALNHQMLDTLTSHLETDGSWNHLVVSQATMAKLRELDQRCRYRERLLDHLGPAFGSNRNQGVRALLTGPSGTGKTLAAKILASELDTDLYRVDLAAVVNKYIGETEKNLHQVLSRAEALDVILLLDEGDALLGNRTEVRSANDRYANLETNYLLQKLENYQGIVIITTNAVENVDTAFQRRMDVVVSFVPPEAQERWHIWQLHLPASHSISAGYLENVAIRCELTGGQIRNAALHATLLALDDDGGKTVQQWHLEEAIQSEYRKAGAICPLTLNGNGKVPQRQQGMQAFLDALSY